MYKTVNLECPINQPKATILSSFSADEEKTVAQASEEIQLALSSLKQVKCYHEVYFMMIKLGIPIT